MCQRQRFHFGLGNDPQASAIRGPDPKGWFITEGDPLDNKAYRFHLTPALQLSDRTLL
jgi:hypothetical protein